MRWMDIGLIVIMAGFVVKGVLQGMIRQLIGLLSVLVALFLGSRLTPWLGAKLSRMPSLRPMALPAAFAIIALGSWALLNLCGILWYNHSRQDDDDHWVDDLGGGVVGLFTGTLLLTILVVGAMRLGVLSADNAAQSVVMRWIMNLADKLVSLVR